jgi:hypothetical protein
MALEPRFDRQKGASKSGESKLTSYSGAGMDTLRTVATKRNLYLTVPFLTQKMGV